MLLLEKPTDIIPSHRNSTKDDNRTLGKDSVYMIVIVLLFSTKVRDFRFLSIHVTTSKRAYWAIERSSPIFLSGQ